MSERVERVKRLQRAGQLIDEALNAHARTRNVLTELGDVLAREVTERMAELSQDELDELTNTKRSA